MEIVVNGEPTTIAAVTVTAFLESLEIDPRRVAVELNQDILPKADYGATLLKDGDRLEIVHFVGGGCAPWRLSNPYAITLLKELCHVSKR